MTKRVATDRELDGAPTLPITLPPSAHRSDPISHGQKPELYPLAHLKKVAIEKHARTDEFEKRLMGIWWCTDQQPVPFVFKTSDGRLRSLDAGCVGFLINRWKPELEAVERDGFVVAVKPIGAILERYETIRERLVAVLTPREQ